MSLPWLEDRQDHHNSAHQDHAHARHIWAWSSCCGCTSLQCQGYVVSAEMSCCVWQASWQWCGHCREWVHAWRQWKGTASVGRWCRWIDPVSELCSSIWLTKCVMNAALVGKFGGGDVAQALNGGSDMQCQHQLIACDGTPTRHMLLEQRQLALGACERLPCHEWSVLCQTAQHASSQAEWSLCLCCGKSWSQRNLTSVTSPFCKPLLC